jgi:hypothetical protein
LDGVELTFLFCEAVAESKSSFAIAIAEPSRKARQDAKMEVVGGNVVDPRRGEWGGVRTWEGYCLRRRIDLFVCPVFGIRG